MKINGAKIETKKITGYSNEIMSLTGSLKELEDVSKRATSISAKRTVKINGFDPNDISGMTINGEAFKIKNISSYSKEVLKLRGNIKQLKQEESEIGNIKIPNFSKNESEKRTITGARTINFENPNINIWSILKEKISSIKPTIQAIQSIFKNTFNSKKPNAELELLNIKISEVKAKLNNAKLNMDYRGVLEAEVELEKLNTKKQKLENENKGNFFSSFFLSLKKVIPSMNNVSEITIKIKNTIKQWSGGLKSGLGHVLKYAGALFSLQSIYSALSNSARSWLSSQNAGAKQLSANIDYMKYAMGSVFAPIIQYVTSLVYQLMKAIQSVAYALTGVNIFAKATANSMNKTAGSASKASKSLSGIHNEINNVSDSNSGGESGSTTPSMDLSQMDTEMSSFSQKLYDFFKPLVDSWNTYSGGLIEQIKTTASQIIGLISSVWGSFENIIANGTVYSIFENILAIIGNIAEAFANAWQNNGNGDVIVQNLANAFNNLLTAINKVIQSEEFQSWLNNCSDKFRIISEKISEIDWQPLIDALSSIGESIGILALDILSGLVDIFKWLVENPIVAEIILGIAIAIGVLSTAYSIWATVTGVLAAVSTALDIALAPLIGIIIAIVAVIAIIVVAIMNWGKITEWLQEKWTQVKQFFSDLRQGICETFSNIGQWFGDKFNKAKESVMNAFSNIGNWFKDRKSDITNAFSNIGNWFKDKFQDAYNGIKNVFSNIGKFFSGIWNGIKNTFSKLGTSIGNAISNSVKSGINGVISLIERTINSAIRLINGGIGMINLIPGVSVGTINTLSLPRLAKGGVLTQATAVVAGEYSGARTNPEIVTPQNIMRDTFEDVLSNYSGNNNDRPINLAVYVGNTKIGQILLDNLRDMKRQTGKDIEALVGD